MNRLFIALTAVLMALLSGCDMIYGHDHDEKTPPNHHQSIDK